MSVSAGTSRSRAQVAPVINTGGQGVRRDGREPGMKKHLTLGDVLRVGVVVAALMGALVVPGTAMAAHQVRPRPRRGWPEQPLRAAAHAHQPPQVGHQPQRHQGRQREPGHRWPDQPPGEGRRDQPLEVGTPTATASRTARTIRTMTASTTRMVEADATPGYQHRQQWRRGRAREDSDDDGVDNVDEQHDGTNPGDADTDNGVSRTARTGTPMATATTTSARPRTVPTTHRATSRKTAPMTTAAPGPYGLVKKQKVDLTPFGCAESTFAVVRPGLERIAALVSEKLWN